MSSESGPRVAALDIGTNTVLMLIAERDSQARLVVIEDHCHTPRLGSGLAQSGSMSAAAVARGLEALQWMAQRCRALGVEPEHAHAVGTAVLRRARNAPAFVTQVQQQTGFAIQVISEAEEAELGARAVRGELGSQQAAVIDVGGGSSEYASADGKRRMSIPIGAVVLAEAGLDRSGQWQLARSLARSFPAADARSLAAVILGGTAVNLACLELALPRFDPVAVEGAQLEPGAAERWAHTLAGLSLEQRLALPIERERASILPEGLICLAAAVERLEPARLWVSGRGLRYGLARKYLGI